MKNVLRLLIGGASSKLFHLKELGDALTKFDVEYKLVKDVDICLGFPDRRPAHWFDSYSKFNTLVQHFKPDAVLVDRLAHFALATLKANLPLFVHLRGDFWSEVKWARGTLYTKPHMRIALWWRKRIAEKCFNGATIILPICKYLENIVRSHYPSKSIEVMYQGIDPARWYHVEGMNLKHPCVGLVQDANIWGKTKEMFTLTKVLEEMPNVTFYWVGDGPYRDYILPTLRKYDNFKWLGSIEYPTKIREYLSEIDVYALVSGIDMAPLTLLEAQLMEKAVVATNVGGIPELMNKDKTGLLVEKGDHKGWIECISTFVNDSKKSQQMGATGRNFVIENFSWEYIAKKLASTIRSFSKN